MLSHDHDRGGRLAKLLVGTATAAGIVAVGLNGGSFDIVPRQTAGLVLWWLVALGALLLSPPPETPGRVGRVVLAAGIGIAAWAALGFGGSLSQGRTADEVARAVVHLAPVVLVGWVLPRSQWRSVVMGAAVGGTAICVVALAERLSPGLMETSRTVVFANSSARLATPLGYWNALGSWGVITALLLLSLASHLRRPPLRAAAMAALPAVVAVSYLTYSRSALAVGALALVVLLIGSRNRWTLAAHAVVLAAASAGTIVAIRASPDIANATGSNGGLKVLIVILVAGLAMAAVGVLTAARKLDDRRMESRTGRLVGRSIAAAAVVISVAAGVAFGPGLWERFSAYEPNAAQAQADDRLTMLNNGARVDQWTVALHSWEDHPWVGTGAGTFELVYNQEGRDGQFVRDAHSGFLEALAEQGLIGLGLLTTFLLGVAASAILAIRRAADAEDRGITAGAAAAIAAFVVGSAVDWLWEVSALALLVMTLVGALVSASRPRPEVVTVKRPKAVRAVLVVAALAAVLVELPGLVGTSEIRRSQAAVRQGDLVAARDRADRAIDTMPWASAPYLQRGLVDERADALPDARRGLELAIARDPHDWRLPLVLARIEAKAGRASEALRAYRQAKALRPRGEFFR